MKRYTFGTSTFDKPVEYCVDYALAHNLKHFEINLAPGHSHLHKFTPARILKLRDLARLHGFSFSFHVPSSLNIGHSVPYLRRRHMRQVARIIAVGAELGITHLTLHLGSVAGHTAMPYFRRYALSKAVSSLKTLTQLCIRHQIILAVENSARLYHNSETEMLGDNLSDFITLFRQIHSPWLGFCLDIGHANTNEGALDYIEHLKDKIKCIHFHDNNGMDDEHLEIGDGTVNWHEVIQALKKINYSGPFISECFKTECHLATARFLQYWRQQTIY
jgi:sugar phosphate isomerase/epimerase